ncbi:hypothetical protein CJJ18_10265 [Candidatus Williamhamiltonella defendens]|uniref:Uncharacterized protein n=1 Tax=Candidatus Williamhamiltonella defendens TaxID=138072 RepID=A0AAC9VNR6_9ENTR|nr:hypothetical protein CJJ18_10265 [Candidatus Hamiltonella defensa]AWK17222.1 hypothetical protein CCS40_10085 [Candidatus Hamiltonella defensa]
MTCFLIFVMEEMIFLMSSILIKILMIVIFKNRDFFDLSFLYALNLQYSLKFKKRFINRMLSQK